MRVMCRHYEHGCGRLVLGIHLLNALYHRGGVSMPVAFERVRKPLWFCDVQPRQIKRAGEVTKNEMMRRA